ncbi:hypothetical protein BY458DRAFT_508590, partial [Sporodiniella umbellata]
MEAIDEFANENIVRSVAFSAIEKIMRGQYQELLPISSQALRQRAQFLGSEDWYQWQKDRSCKVLERLASDPDGLTEDVYQNTVYYKRLDATTLHAVIEFAEEEAWHYIVILLLGEGSSDMSDVKYHNIKEMSDEEWLDVFENWSRSLEEAERVFLSKVTRPKRVFSNGENEENGSTDHGYWGKWSSDEEEEEEKVTQAPEEDTYYSKWSQEITQQEIEEEYDQSYNPLFTVPSVPNLMDVHTAALSELTQMLKSSIPPGSHEKFPGAYPESGARTPHIKYSQDAGRQLFMKSLSALLGAGKLLGYENKEMMAMVGEMMNN